MTVYPRQPGGDSRSAAFAAPLIGGNEERGSLLGGSALRGEQVEGHAPGEWLHLEPWPLASGDLLAGVRSRSRGRTTGVEFNQQARRWW
jgi:hypothetical protein